MYFVHAMHILSHHTSFEEASPYCCFCIAKSHRELSDSERLKFLSEKIAVLEPQFYAIVPKLDHFTSYWYSTHLALGHICTD